MAGLYFEEFVVGHVFRHAVTRTVTEMGAIFSQMSICRAVASRYGE